MKIEYKVYCHEHGEEINIFGADMDETDTIAFEISSCSQCQSESYEKGIESVLSKGYARNEGL